MDIYFSTVDCKSGEMHWMGRKPSSVAGTNTAIKLAEKLIRNKRITKVKVTTPVGGINFDQHHIR